MTEEEKKELVQAAIAEMQSTKRKGIWQRMESWHRAIIVVIGLGAGAASLWQGITAIAQFVLQEEIEEWKQIKRRTERTEKTVELQSKTLKEKTLEFSNWANMLEEKVRFMEKAGSEFHAVGLRADSSCNMYYRDRCGYIYKVYPDLEFSTDQMTYWYYIDKSHNKRYIFNEQIN